MPRRDSLLDELSDKFTKSEFTVTRGIETKPYRLEIVACKNAFGIFKGRMTCFIMMTTMDTVNKEKVLDFSTLATRYAIDNSTMFLPTEPGNSFLIVPVVVSDTVGVDLRDWIKNAVFKKHWGTFEFPVIMCHVEQATYYSQRTPLWGSAFYKNFRKFVVDLLKF
jgi:hypothetical protein